MIVKGKKNYLIKKLKVKEKKIPWIGLRILAIVKKLILKSKKKKNRLT